MAIAFMMWAECSNAEDRSALAQHFHGFQTTLLTGRTITWQAYKANGTDGVEVYSENLSKTGMVKLQDCLELTESGLRLYHHLKNGPAFKFARVAWEAGLVPLHDLKDYLEPIAPDMCRLAIDCVMEESVYKEIGSPQFCYPFREGYRWTRYSGEKYVPLSSRDQPDLTALCMSLFPDYYKY